MSINDVIGCLLSQERPTEDTPVKAFLKKEVETIAKLHAVSKRRIKTLQQAQRRTEQRVAKLQNVLTDLTSKNIVLQGNASCLENIAGANKDVLMRQTVKRGVIGLPCQYSPELRAFALTLHFYSPRAYNYVRQTSDTCLPHPRTIKKWYQSADSEPGFSKEVLAALEMKAEDNRKKGVETVCSLMVDEMAVRRHVEWDGRKTYGYVNVGPGSEDDGVVAKEAFVILVVALNEQWKLPLGYFLVVGISGEQRSAIVSEGLSLAHKAGATVVSLTCDGAVANLAMLRSLGCCLAFDNKLTVRQFAAAYKKKMIVHTEVEDSPKGNGLPLENITILHVSSAAQLRSEDVINWTSKRKNLVTEDLQLDLRDHDYFPDPTEPSIFGDRVIVYVAGYIARYLQGCLKLRDLCS